MTAILQLRGFAYLVLFLTALYAVFLLYESFNWAHYIYASTLEELNHETQTKN